MTDYTINDLLLEQFLPYRLSVLSNRVSHAIATSYGEQFNLTIPGWRVIVILNRFPDIVAADLVEKTAMDKVAISRAVSMLLDRGWVSRQEHSNDRRRWVLNLTNEGREIYHKIVPLALSYETDLLKSFSEQEVQLLHRLLDRLFDRVTDWKTSKK